MVLEVVAAAVANFVAPHLRTAADAVVATLGEAAGGIVTSLVAAVRQKLGSGTEGDGALDRAAEAPGDASAIKELTGRLEAAMQRDDAFAKELERLVGEARSEPALKAVVERVENAGSGVQFSNQIAGPVDRVQQVGNIEGDVTFN